MGTPASASMMAPETIGRAKTLFSTRIDDRHRATGGCQHILNKVLLGPAKALVIAQYPGDKQFYLFGCDEQWNVITDTVGDSLAQVFNQAEFEYEGVSKTWRKHA